MKNILHFIFIYFLSWSLFAATARDIGTDTLTLKTQSTTPSNPASGYKKAYFKGTGLKLLDSSGNETGVGSSSSDNYLTYGDAENGITGWATYADTAGLAPVDGTGGTSAITWAASSTSPIDGVQSYTFTHPASNAQGSGASYDFTIPKAASTKAITISFLYEILSGTYSGGSGSDSDVEFYIYDVDGSTLLYPTQNRLDQSVSGYTYPASGTFQAPYFTTTTRNLRLIVHSATTTTSAFVLKLDNFKVATVPRISNIGRAQLMGTITITGCNFSTTSTSYVDMTATGCSYSTTGQAQTPSTMLPAIRFTSLPPGDYRLEYEGNLSSNQSTGYTASYQFWDGTNTAREQSVSSQYYAGGIPGISQSISYLSTQSNVTLSIRAKSSASPNSAVVNNTNYGTIKVWYFPSVASQVNDLGSQRTVLFSGAITASQSITANTTNIAATSLKDTHGGWNGSVYTIPESGDYRISSILYTSSGSPAVRVYKNGSSYKLLTQTAIGSPYSGTVVLPNLAPGDTVSIRGDVTSTLSSDTGMSISIEKIMGPSQPIPTETISVSYYLSANFTASGTIPINFDSKEFDSHNAVTVSSTAWKFTAPATGLYLVTPNIYFTTPTAIDCFLYKNGTLYKYIGTANSNSSIYGRAGLPVLIRLNAGDYIDLRPNTSIGISGGTLASSSAASITVTRMGL